MTEALDHPIHVGFGNDLAKPAAAPFELLSNPAVVPHEVPRQLDEPDLLPAQPLGLFPIERHRTERVEVNSIEDRSKHTGRAIVRLHRVGEDQLTPGLEHAIDLLEDAGPIPRMQESVLRPRVVQARRAERNLLETAIVIRDSVFETGGSRELAIAFVLRLAEVYARDMAAFVRREPAGRAAVPGSRVDHAATRTEPVKTAGDRLHRASRRTSDRFVLGLVKSDVNVFAAPNVEVEVVGVVAVVVIPCRLHDRGVPGAHDDSSPCVLTYFFSAT